MCDFPSQQTHGVRRAPNANANTVRTSSTSTCMAAGTSIALMFRRSSVAILLLVIATFIPAVMAVDEVVVWERNHPQGGKPYDQLQCQTITVQWGGDGRPHSLYEFQDELAYKNCDFSNAFLLIGPQTTGSYVVSREDNQTPGKKWFASDVPDDINNPGINDCTNFRMKFSVKIRPLFQDKFPGYECDGDFDPANVVVKNAVDIKECRKICKRRRGCVSIQYIGGSKQKCRLFDKAPFRAVQKNAQTSCEVATTSCDPNVRSPVQVVAKPEDQDGCVFCNNHRSPTMLGRNSVCDSCRNCRPVECTSGQGFCEFTCWITGYDIGKKCCDISAQKPDDGKNCQECTNHRTQYMVENGQECATYDFAFTNRCSVEIPADTFTGTAAFRSWWLDSPIQYCQYSCWDNDVGYQGKTIYGTQHVGEKANQFPQTFDSRPCCERGDETDADLFPVSIK